MSHETENGEDSPVGSGRGGAEDAEAGSSGRPLVGAGAQALRFYAVDTRRQIAAHVHFDGAVSRFVPMPQAAPPQAGDSYVRQDLGGRLFRYDGRRWVEASDG